MFNFRLFAQTHYRGLLAEKIYLYIELMLKSLLVRSELPSRSLVETQKCAPKVGAAPF